MYERQLRSRRGQLIAFLLDVSQRFAAKRSAKMTQEDDEQRRLVRKLREALSVLIVRGGERGGELR